MRGPDETRAGHRAYRRALAVGAAGLVALSMLLSLSACKMHLTADWYPRRAWNDLSELQLAKAKDAAVILKREQQFAYVLGKNSYLEVMQHDVVRVVTEAGIGLANIRIAAGPTDELVELRARAIQPDGTVQEVEPEREMVDKTVVEGQVIRSRIVRIPGVRAGTILEYFWIVRHEGLPSFIRRTVTDRMPIQEYDLTFSVSKDVGFQIRHYNADAEMRVNDEGLGKVARLHLENVPKSESEDYGPDGSLNRPWWAFSLRSLGRTVGWATSWNTALKGVAYQILVDEDEDIFDGYDPDIDTSACKGERCRVQAALDFVHDHIRYDGFTEWFSVRPMSKVVKSGTGESFELAYLLYEALDEVGIDADLALINRYLSRGFDRDLPSATWFNHGVLVIEPQGDIEERLIVDPTCKWCPIGTLPWWSRDTWGVVLQPNPQFLTDFTLSTTLINLSARAPRAPKKHKTVDLVVDEEGDATGSIHGRSEGASALGLFRVAPQRTKGAHKRLAESDVRKRFKDGKRTENEPVTCEARDGVCTWRVDFKARSVAVRTAERLIVPLSFLRTVRDGTFDDPERTYDLFVRYDEEVSETLRITVPDGWVLDEAPSPEHLASDAFAFSLEVAPTADGVELTRRLKERRGHFPREAYDALRAPVLRFSEMKRQLVAFRRSAQPPPPADPAAAPGL